MNKGFIFFILFIALFKKGRLVESVIERQPIYQDDDFKSFTYFFASSPSASFLSRIVHSSDSRFVQLKSTSIWTNTIDKASAINQVSNKILRTFISLLLFALSPYFMYLGIYGNTKNHLTLTLSSIWSYFSLLLGFYLTNGIFNIGLVCSLSLIFGLFMFYIAHSDLTTRTLYRCIRYLSSMVFAKFIYDIGTHLKGDISSMLDYGFTGSLYIEFLHGNSYVLLKLLHILVLASIAYIIIKLFPNLFSNKSIQSPLSIKFDKFLLSFLCALPVAAALTQIHFLLTNSLNPIDPSIFFMIPSSINFLSVHTVVALSTWILTTAKFYYLSELVEKDYNHPLNRIPNLIQKFI